MNQPNEKIRPPLPNVCVRYNIYSIYMYNEYEYTYRTVYIPDTTLHAYQIYILLNVSTRYVYLYEWRHKLCGHKTTHTSDSSAPDSSS